MQPIARTRQSHILIACGYDLLARAVSDTLVDAGFSPCGVIWADILEAKHQQVDLLIADETAFERHKGVTRIEIIRRKLPSLPVMVLDSQCQPQRMLQASRLGVRGHLYLGDQLVQRLPQAVLDVLEGGTYYSPTAAAALTSAEHHQSNVLPKLTPYQRDVLRYMAQHWSAGKIAAELGRSTTAIYKVQAYLRELFSVETNGELLDQVTAWQVTSEI